MADVGLEHKFEKLIKEMVAGMPDVESAEQLKQGLRRHWEKPPLEELELISRRTYNLREARLLLFSAGRLRDDIVKLAGSHTLTNVVARNNDEVDTEALIVTIRKLLERDIFGLEKYFIWGVRPVVKTLASSAEKDPTLRAVEEYAQALGVQSRFIAQLCSVADEFITNAIYNAPRDAEGRALYAERSRTEPVHLKPSELVEVRFCCDGHRIGISVADPFGSLSTETLLDYLAKCTRRGEDQVDQKPGGAGLGFYYVFESLSHFVVNISAGKKTEMIGIIDVSGSYKDFSLKTKSFNIFFSETAG